MPLPTSGPLSINDIKAEFGGAAPDSLTEYYRGGVLVPNTPTNAGVPTSGAISILDFYGASAVTGTPLSLTVGRFTPTKGITVYGFPPSGSGPGSTVSGALSPTTYKTGTVSEIEWGTVTNNMTIEISGSGFVAGDLDEVDFFTNLDVAQTGTRTGFSTFTGGAVWVITFPSPIFITVGATRTIVLRDT